MQKRNMSEADSLLLDSRANSQSGFFLGVQLGTSCHPLDGTHRGGMKHLRNKFMVLSIFNTLQIPTSH